MGEIYPGENTADVGSGAGLDSLIAALLLGEAGEVIGVDITLEMVAKASQNALNDGDSNVKFVEGFNEDLPVQSEWVDLVLSNGAINLSPDKDVIFAESFQVLKPDGRQHVADILVRKQIPDSAKNNLNLSAR